MTSINLSQVRGDTAVWQATFTDQATPPNLINDAGATYRMTIKRNPGALDAAAIAQVSANQSTPGVALLTIPPSATAGLQCPVTLVYDIQVTETGGRVTTIAQGTYTVTADVTTTAP